ncbi:acetylglutamate kinase [Tepidibacillus fermentans]|uniref:Acetylglutamate kinase n=1 Tax=Tepidibacillus fermentans TaxID=1281767 RepID=A0A4R3KIA6_9BACI|nr:acetylglutamate kinase [Tepidibacillus fermentans]TCS83286.1 N-acetylglutamate kinase [Tepidibacillus fermentans]
MNTFGSMHRIAHKETVKNDKKLVLLKIGGSVLNELTDRFYREMIEMMDDGWFPVIVHGGGPSITMMLEQLGIQSSFVNGLRVTDKETLQVVEMVLNGKENKEIVRKIQAVGGNAVGLSGIDHGIIQAECLDPSLGYVGKVKSISFPWLSIFQTQKIIPVISPLGIDRYGQVFNINADMVAQALAVHLQAKKLVMISDTPGIYQMEKGEKKIIHQLDPQGVERLIAEGEISKGMIPKVQAALHCLETGIEEVYVVDGRMQGVLSKVLDGDQIGTRICKAEVVL